MTPLWLRRLVGAPVLAWRVRALEEFRRELATPRAVQQATLTRILQHLASSALSRDFSLRRVRAPADLRQALPVADYARLAPYVARIMETGDTSALFAPGTRVLLFAQTSGTTAAVKHIPVTPACLASYRRSWAVWGAGLSVDHPRAPFGGTINLVSGGHGLRAPSGIPIGSISGLLGRMMHRTLRLVNCVPPVVSEIQDPAQRQYVALRLALPRNEATLITTANPSTLLAWAERLAAAQDALIRDIADGTLQDVSSLPAAVHNALAPFLRPDPAAARRLTALAAAAPLTPAAAWPALAALGVWTGGTLAPYLAALAPLYGALPLRDHGLSASEGRFTIPLADDSASGPLNLRGAFYEFIPEADYGQENPRTLLADELTPGHRYALIVTTTGGLVRYDMADIVECTGFFAQTPLVRFLGKARHIANITGEKLSAWQATEAVRQAAAQLSLPLCEWTLAPHVTPGGRYYLLVEQKASPPAAVATRLAHAIDERLASLNAEYADKRASRRLAPVALLTVPDGTFAAWRAAHLAQAGAALEQYKHPFLRADPELLPGLLAAQAKGRAS